MYETILLVTISQTAAINGGGGVISLDPVDGKNKRIVITNSSKEGEKKQATTENVGNKLTEKKMRYRNSVIDNFLTTERVSTTFNRVSFANISIILKYKLFV